MRITVDRKRCEGFGFCAERAPGLLQLDDEGELEVLTDEVPADQHEPAHRAVRSCPVAALQVSER